MIDWFKKGKDEENVGLEEGPESGIEMVEEKPPEQDYSSAEQIKQESDLGGSSSPTDEDTTSQLEKSSASQASNIGIEALMGKRVKLEEAIDYVGVMIKNLKEKRTSLEKEIEDESVDVKNLKEKLGKVSEYIDEENQGIQTLTRKRAQVENEADEVGTLINNLRNKLSGIDSIIEDEGNRIKNFKSSREKL